MKFVSNNGGDLTEVILPITPPIPPIGNNIAVAYLDLTETYEGLNHMAHNLTTFEGFLIAIIIYLGWKGLEWFIKAYEKERNSRPKERAV